MLSATKHRFLVQLMSVRHPTSFIPSIQNLYITFSGGRSQEDHRFLRPESAYPDSLKNVAYDV